MWKGSEVKVRVIAKEPVKVTVKVVYFILLLLLLLLGKMDK